MKSKSLSVGLVLAALLALSAGLSAAQGPAPQGPAGPQAMIGSAFTYQGQLLKDGGPVNANCTMVFSLYDDAAGNPVGSPITLTVTVANGLFTSPLDFGSGVFTGDGRWLEVAVQCPGDAGFNTLTPRQALTAAPYALSLRPGAEVSGDLPGQDVLQVNNTATSGTSYGLHGQSESPSGAGVVGWNTATTGTTSGVRGVALSTAGRGVYGLTTASSGSTYGVYGEAQSTAGIGVRGYAGATSGTTYGVHGEVDSTGGRGVVGYATAASGDARGVYGRSDSAAGVGVYGYATAASGTAYGVYGQVSSTDGYGVYGTGPVIGAYGRASAASGTTSGVYGRSDSPDGHGVYGWATAASGAPTGVYGESNADQGKGVHGVAYGTTALANGVLGEAYNGMANGVSGLVWATTGTGVGVFGSTYSPSGYAGYFSGHVHVNGTLSAVVKMFMIDHPLDPANRYLYHYSVESSEVLNQYSGNVVLGADGSAWVELPAWFSAINRDVRYQLTPVGGAAPGLYIAQEVRDNRFQIAGGPPGLKVSWLVTAVRSDPYIQRYGTPVEVQKPAEERGTYLFPELYGQPEELGRDYRFSPSRPAPAEAEPPTAEEMP